MYFLWAYNGVLSALVIFASNHIHWTVNMCRWPLRFEFRLSTRVTSAAAENQGHPAIIAVRSVDTQVSQQGVLFAVIKDHHLYHPGHQVIL